MRKPRFKCEPCSGFLDVPGATHICSRSSVSLPVEQGILGCVVFKMEDSGLPGPRNSGLVRTRGGHAGPRRECGRRADPEPQEREGPRVEKKLCGMRSRGLARVPEPPPCGPVKTLAVVLAAVSARGGCAAECPPASGLCPAGFVYWRVEHKKAALGKTPLQKLPWDSGIWAGEGRKLSSLFAKHKNKFLFLVKHCKSKEQEGSSRGPSPVKFWQGGFVYF